MSGIRYQVSVPEINFFVKIFYVKIIKTNINNFLTCDILIDLFFGDRSVAPRYRLEHRQEIVIRDKPRSVDVEFSTGANGERRGGRRWCD